MKDVVSAKCADILERVLDAKASNLQNTFEKSADAFDQRNAAR